jgi:hypothetical protein
VINFLPDDRIVYDRATGALYYDPDGNGEAAAMKFAQLEKGAALAWTDIVLY